jgi:hypothetical protein
MSPGQVQKPKSNISLAQTSGLDQKRFTNSFSSNAVQIFWKEEAITESLQSEMKLYICLKTLCVYNRKKTGKFNVAENGYEKLGLNSLDSSNISQSNMLLELKTKRWESMANLT